MEVLVTTGAIRRAKLQAKCHHHHKTNTQELLTTCLVHTSSAAVSSPWKWYRRPTAWCRLHLISQSAQSATPASDRRGQHDMSDGNRSDESDSAYSFSSATSTSFNQMSRNRNSIHCSDGNISNRNSIHTSYTLRMLHKITRQVIVVKLIPISLSLSVSVAIFQVDLSYPELVIHLKTFYLTRPFYHDIIRRPCCAPALTSS